MSLTAAVQRAIARTGQPLTLRRIATGVAPVAVAVTGVVRGYAPHELVGGIVQGDRRVVISNAEIAAASWPGPPRKGDQVVDGTQVLTIQAVNTVTRGSAIAKHEITARG